MADTGYTVTFAGAAARTDASPLSAVDGSDGVAGTVRETVKGTPGFAALDPGYDRVDRHRGGHRLHVTFNALTPLGSARQTGLGDVSQLTLQRQRRHA